jgi:hypothetical protein
MDQPLSLRDATVQDIQLELIRRCRFNDMNGERIHASLMKHRELWLAVLLDRQGIANFEEPGWLLMSGLIKLRDLDQNIWNADKLFVLKRDQARELARIAEEEDCSAKSTCTKASGRPTWLWVWDGGSTGCCRSGGIRATSSHTEFRA